MILGALFGRGGHEAHSSAPANSPVAAQLTADLGELLVRLRDDRDQRYVFPGTLSWHVAARYALALGGVGAAIGTRWLLDPILGDQLVFGPLFIVLLPLLLLVRPRTFLVAALLGLMGTWYLFVPPRFSFRVEESMAAVQLGFYIATVFAATLAAWLAQQLRWQLGVAEQRVGLSELVSVGFFDTNWGPTDLVSRLFGPSAGLDPSSTSTQATAYEHVDLQELAKAKEVISTAVRRQLNDVSFEYSVVVPNGVRRWFAATGKLSYRARDGAVRLMGATIDITERKRAEEQVRLADQRKDEFLAALAHELRNPLSSIRNSAEVLRPRMSAEQIVWCRDLIKRQTSYLTRLVDDLLDLSRIAHDKLPLHMEHVALTHIIRDAIEMVQPSCDRRSLTVTAELQDDRVTVFADRVRLTQVFVNLLSNAAKFSPNGASIKIKGKTDGHEVVISVIDQGVGIPAEFLGSVFDVFAQPHRPMDSADSGLGLGLAIVRKLTQLHGGTVAAFSAGRGCGSEFVVRLPFRDVPIGPLAANQAARI